MCPDSRHSMVYGNCASRHTSRRLARSPPHRISNVTVTNRECMNEMMDFEDANGAISTTANTLLAAGVDPIVISIALAHSAVTFFTKASGESSPTEADIEQFLEQLRAALFGSSILK